MKDFSLILPTRSHLDLVKRLFDSILETSANLDLLEIILCIDEDDPEGRKISHALLTIQKITLPRSSMGSIIRNCYSKSTARYIVLINDDVIFRTKGWDIKVLEVFSRFSDDLVLVYCNDLYYGKRLSPFPILSRTACDLMDNICPAKYKGHCIDSHIFDVFKRLSQLGHKRLIYLPNVIFEHMHYGVTLSSYEGSFFNANRADDQLSYLSFAEERRQIAFKMAQYIESSTKKTSEPAPPLVSIVIHFSNNLSQYTATCLEAIYDDNKYKQLDFEIVVISDDSTKNISSFPKKLRDRITMVSCKDANTAKAFNKGAAIAKGDYLVFLDDKCLPRGGWLEALVESARNQEIAIVGSKWLNPRNGRVEHIGVSFFKDNKTIKDTCIYKGFSPVHPAVDKIREFQAVKIPGMLVKKDVFLQVKGFDENLIGLEYMDLCLKVRKLGKKVIYSPQAGLYRYDQEITEKDTNNYIDLKNLPLSLKGQIECDLEKQLSQDGFSLCLEKATRYIQPSPSYKDKIVNRF